MPAKDCKELRVFLNAEGYRVSSLVLSAHWNMGKNRTCELPIYVVLAFTCELYLKCIMVMRGLTPPHNHKLHTLFDKLPVGDQADLVLEYGALCKNNAEHDAFFKNNPKYKDDFRSVLEAGSQVFQKIRYAYEGLAPGESHLAYFSLPNTALRNVILANHPDWPSRL